MPRSLSSRDESNSTSSSEDSTSSSGGGSTSSPKPSSSHTDMSRLKTHFDSSRPFKGKLREPLVENPSKSPEIAVIDSSPRKVRAAESTRSNLTRSKIDELLSSPHSKDVIFHVPEPSDRITLPPFDSIGFYATVITLGIDPSIHPFFVSILESYGIAPAQLNLFALCHMMGVLFIWSDLGFGVPGLNIWHYLYKTSPIKLHPQYYFFSRWPKGREALVKLPSSSAGGWRERFFFIDVATGGPGLREEFSDASG